MAAPSSSTSAASVTSASATLQAATAKQSVVDAYFEVAKALKKTSEALVTYTNALAASPNHDHLVSLLTNASPLQQSSSRHKRSSSTSSPPEDLTSVSPTAWPQLFAPLLVTLGLGLDPAFRTDHGPVPSSSRQHAGRDATSSFAHPANGVTESTRRKRSRDSDSEDEDVPSPSSGSPSKDGNSVSAADSGRKPRSKRPREPKDPLAPKGPPSAYIIYQNDVKDIKRAEHPNESYTQIMRLIADDWSKLDAETKKAYTDRADRERELYKEKTREWRESRRASMSMVGSGSLGPLHGAMGNMSPIPGLGTPFMGSTGFDMSAALSYAAPQTGYTVRPSTADGHPNTRRGSVFEGPSSRHQGMYMSATPYPNGFSHVPPTNLPLTSGATQRSSTATDSMPHPLSMSFTQLSDLNLPSAGLGVSDAPMHHIDPSVLPRSARNSVSMASGMNFLNSNTNVGFGPPMTPIAPYSSAPDPGFTFGSSGPAPSGIVSAEDMMGMRSAGTSGSGSNGPNGVAATGSRRMSGP